MNRYGREMMRRPMRDGRNPYGSKGGYITSRDPRRRDRAMRDWREPAYEMRSGRYDDMENSIGRPAHVIGEEYDRASRYPFRVEGEFGRYDGHNYDPYEDGNYDYARGRNGRYMRDRAYGYDYDDGELLTDRELNEWMQDLMSEVEEKDKPMLKMESVIKRAKELGIQFDKFTEEEFQVAVLMEFTDYGKTVGTASIDKIIMMGKDFLCDPDSELKYGEKLAAYKRYVVDGE